MLDADVDSFLNVPVADSLVDYDSHRGFGDVVDDTGFAMVNFVRHAVVSISKADLFIESRRKDQPFLNGSVGFDVNDVPDSENPSAYLLQT